MRPWTEPACRTLFPLLLPKHRTDGSWEDCRSRQPVPQTTSDGRTEVSKPHWSTLRIWGEDGGVVQTGSGLKGEDVSWENLGVLPQDISWPSPRTPLWTLVPQTGTWVWSTLVCTLFLFSEDMHCFRNSGCIHLQFVFLVPERPAYLCFFSPVASASDRNSLFSSDFSFQLSAAAAAPDQRKWHQKSEGL